MNIHAAQTIFAIGDDGSISVGLNYVIVGTKHFLSSSSFLLKRKHNPGLGMLTTPIIARRYGSTTAHACKVRQFKTHYIQSYYKIILLLGMLQLTLGTWFLSFAYTYPLFLVANGVRSGSTSVVHVSPLFCPLYYFPTLFKIVLLKIKIKRYINRSCYNKRRRHRFEAVCLRLK